MPDTQNDSYAELAKATLAASRELIAHADRWRPSDVHPIRVSAWVAAGAAAVLLVSCLGFWWRAARAEAALSEAQAMVIRLDHEMRARLGEQSERVKELEDWKPKQIEFNRVTASAVEELSK